MNFLNTTYVSLLSVGCVWFVSRLNRTIIAKTNPKTLRGIARALSESALHNCCTVLNEIAVTRVAVRRAFFKYKDGLARRMVDLKSEISRIFDVKYFRTLLGKITAVKCRCIFRGIGIS